LPASYRGPGPAGPYPDGSAPAASQPGGAAEHNEKLRPIAVADEVERLLHRLVGLAARGCTQVRGELVQHRMPELRVPGEQRQQESQRLGEVDGGCPSR
jgi:hypothetical protein